MIDEADCNHDRTDPVHAVLRAENVKVGDTVEYLTREDGQLLVVARICLDCRAQLHPGWGCPDCEWSSFETRALCDPAPTIHHALARPCREHA